MSKDYQISPILNHFSYVHLPQYLQDVSAHICDVAIRLDKLLEDNEEKQMGLRKLLEAKDCFVRAQLESMNKAKQAEKLKFRKGPVPGQYKGGTC